MKKQTSEHERWNLSQRVPRACKKFRTKKKIIKSKLNLISDRFLYLGKQKCLNLNDVSILFFFFFEGRNLDLLKKE